MAKRTSQPDSSDTESGGSRHSSRRITPTAKAAANAKAKPEAKAKPAKSGPVSGQPPEKRSKPTDPATLNPVHLDGDSDVEDDEITVAALPGKRGKFSYTLTKQSNR
jgi:hypothetical protein